MSTTSEEEKEKTRVAAAKTLQLMDTPAEARFDRITRMVQVVFAVPIAAISIIDDERQWFKSARGLCSTESSRHDPFCANTLTCAGPFVIEDTLEHPHFRHHPWVQGAPHIRFYAGIGLYSAGHCVGILCLMDARPRAFSTTALASLLDLGQWAEHEIDRVNDRHTNAMHMESRLRLSAVLENALDGIITLTADGFIESANPAALTMLGYEHQALLHQDVRALLCEHDRKIVPAILLRLNNGELPHSRSGLSITGVHRDGSELALEVSYNTVKANGSFTVIAIFRDVSAHKQVAQMKQDFISTVSHELRTPLTAIIGALGLVREAYANTLDAQVLPLLEMAYQNGLRLNSLMQDVSELDRMDNGKVQVFLAPCSVDALLADIMLEHTEAMNASGVHLTIAPPSGMWVMADQARLLWILSRLLDNAFRFSARGDTVTVDVVEFGRRICFSVQDQGPGIPESLRPQLFKRFSKIRHENVGRQAGAGLSLYLCQSLTEKMEGQIGYTAINSGGSRFFITLPQADPTPQI